MKKLGLRALAGGLAVLMVAGFSVPAEAKAEDVLLISPAPTSALKVLEITADMVDEDGEIVISGGEYDRIVIAKEVDAKDIYFDQVTVKEMVVESGSNSNIQLWEVEAEEVKVTEPDIKDIDMAQFRTLLADENTRDKAFELYTAQKEENAKIAKKTPRITTMEDAKVEAISTAANVRLDLEAGEVKVLNVEAGEKNAQANVTVEGYNGDVVFKSEKENLSIVNLKAVDSRLNSLKVEGAAKNSYLNLSSRDAVVMSVEVAGDTAVSLNIPTGELKLSEEAAAAQVTVLNAVESLNVAASNAKINIAQVGSVVDALVAGDKVTISGQGELVAAEITGSGAYVSTSGTKVDGENMYVERPYEAPKVVIKDINLAPGNNTVVKNGNGSATINFNGQYSASTFTVPETVDVASVYSVVLNITSGAQFGATISTKGGEAISSSYPGYDLSGVETRDYEFGMDPSMQRVATIAIQSLQNGQAPLTINSITFMLLEEPAELIPMAPPTAPGTLELEGGSKVYSFAELGGSGYGCTTSEADFGGQKVEMNAQYRSIEYRLPEPIKLGDFSKGIITMSSSTGPVGVEVYDSAGQKIAFWWNVSSKATADIELSYGGTGYNGNAAISSADKNRMVSSIKIMSTAGAPEMVLYRIAFVAKTVVVTPEEQINDAYYYENFTGDYAVNGWGVVKGLATYSLSSFTLMDDAGSAYEGNYFAKLKMNDAYNGIAYSLDNSTGGSDATFTFSAYIKSTGVAGEEFVRMGVGASYTDATYWTATDDWTQISKELVVAAGESKTFVFSAQDPAYCEAEDGQMACVYLDKVVIRKN